MKGYGIYITVRVLDDLLPEAGTMPQDWYVTWYQFSLLIIRRDAYERGNKHIPLDSDLLAA